MLNLPNLHYTKQGEGLPIVCLHGFSEDASTWQSLFDEVKKNKAQYAMYCIDLIGHGKSPRPHSIEYYAIDYLVDKIHATLQMAFSGKRKTPYVLLGYSLGGRVAMHYALKYTCELSAIILESSSFGIADYAKRQERKIQDEELALVIEQQGIEFFEKYWSNLTLFKSQQSLSDKIKQEIKTRRLQNDPRCLANILRMLGQGNLSYMANSFFALQLPKLYICGELDEKYLAVAQGLEHKSIDVQMIAKAGHNTHLEQSTKFYELVHEFLCLQKLSSISG